MAKGDTILVCLIRPSGEKFVCVFNSKSIAEDLGQLDVACKRWLANDDVDFGQSERHQMFADLLHRHNSGLL